MHEGRNRQIRRTFGSLGYMVKALHRTQFGTFALGDLAPGAYETFEK
jgi:23S rRNA pseudouridine2605 synthase